MYTALWKPLRYCTLNQKLAMQEEPGLQRNEAEKVEERKIRKQILEQSAYSNSEQSGVQGSIRGQHVDTVPRLIPHLYPSANGRFKL